MSPIARFLVWCRGCWVPGKSSSSSKERRILYVETLSQRLKPDGGGVGDGGGEWDVDVVKWCQMDAECFMESFGTQRPMLQWCGGVGKWSQKQPICEPFWCNFLCNPNVAVMWWCRWWSQWQPSANFDDTTSYAIKLLQMVWWCWWWSQMQPVADLGDAT